MGYNVRKLPFLYLCVFIYLTFGVKIADAPKSGVAQETLLCVEEAKLWPNKKPDHIIHKTTCLFNGLIISTPLIDAVISPKSYTPQDSPQKPVHHIMLL